MTYIVTFYRSYTNTNLQSFFIYVLGAERLSEEESSLPTTSRSRPASSRPMRAIARTQHSERVRANVNRHRITQARTAAQVCMMLMFGSPNLLVLRLKRTTVGCCQCPQKCHIFNTFLALFLLKQTWMLGISKCGHELGLF